MSQEPASQKAIALHYERAQSMCRHAALSLGDIQHLSQKFWNFHFDLIAARDMTAFIIATIHVNLCIGTLSPFIRDRPDLADLLEKLLNFDLCGQFMLTEVGHGLDARRPGDQGDAASRWLLRPPHPQRRSGKGDASDYSLLWNAKSRNRVCSPDGTLSLSIMGVSAIKVGTHIAGTYSQRRTITAPDGHTCLPIMSFSTQQRPIIEGWVQGLVSELLGGKYSLPAPRDPTAVLARREQRMMEAAMSKLKDIGGYGGHRGQAFNQHILPCCRPIAEAIGHRMAYEAATELGACPKVLRLYEHMCVGTDFRQFSCDGHTLQAFEDAAVEAYDDVFADMLQSLQNSEADAYTTAPIMSNKSWAVFVDKMQAFKGPSGHARGAQPKL
ncbi:hypothetical protein MRS44_013515 [Fusarium solani]|uniref:uncharacterized protein n=1 Tax=Fusarium solani TaxID=169388 RepID=UPI0032C3F3AF|nr:hypothetical protein MRS44_013515 [Fusarium solani]